MTDSAATESAVEIETKSESTGSASDVESSVAVVGDDVADTASDAAETPESDDADDDSDDDLVEEGEIAGDYLEQLLDVLDFDGDIDLDVEGDRAIVSIDGGRDLAKLVGRKGEVLDALQELTRLAVQQSTGDRSRLMLDIAGWRAQRRADLTAQGQEAARKVLESGEREVLTPMTPFERKIVHDAVAGIEGVASESEGVEPSRRVVVIKA
ncbi:Jag family protein [Antrihabitans cavernicola]|uniref:Jag family protein n=1 Tax=Antrihabitans cavernicola TaxID=2495913 RepID=UPI00165912AC